MNKLKFTIYFSATILILNIFAYGVIYLQTNINMYSEDFKSFKKRFSKNEKKEIFPHPFFGYSDTKSKIVKNNLNNNEPLFYHVPDLVEPEDIKILILGGSVATHLSHNHSNDQFIINSDKYNKFDIFQKTLNSRLNTTKFKVFNAAIPGGKQPQQLFKFNYLLLNGYKFDIVINIDGLNELALSIAENIPIKNNVIYPRQYSRQIKAFNKNINCTKNSNKSIHDKSIFPIKELYNLFIIYSCHKKIYGVKNQIDTDFYLLSKFKDEKFEIKLNKVINLWEKSSQMISELSKSYQFDYIHVLQPNQYFENSKPLTKEEQEISNFKKYEEPIKKYYDKFKIQNINSKYKFDARYIFESNNENLYRDYCCHLNNKGMYLLSNNIIDKFEDLFISFIQAN